jgi:hypothetical protein
MLYVYLRIYHIQMEQIVLNVQINNFSLLKQVNVEIAVMVHILITTKEFVQK